MLWRRLIHASLLGSLLSVALPAGVYACVYGTWFNVEAAPANGLVRMRWHCPNRKCGDKELPNPLQIVDAETMANVAGEIVWSHGMGTQAMTVFWRPSESLVEGRNYRVLGVEESIERKPTFAVTPAVTWASTDQLEASANLDTEVSIDAGDITCPARYKRTTCSADAPPSPTDVTLDTLERRIAWLSAGLTSAAGRTPPRKEKAVFWREGDEQPDLASMPWGLDAGRQRFDEQAARYCYRVAAHNLLDGSEREWEGCLEHGDLPALEAHDRDDELIAKETARCSEPPSGLENEWCEQSLIACREGVQPPPSFCENVEKRCSESSDASNMADAGDEQTRRKSGCSMAPAPSTGAPWLLLSAALALFALRRRRRSDHSPG